MFSILFISRNQLHLSPLTGHDWAIVIRSVTSRYCLQGHLRILFRSWARRLIVFLFFISEICIMKRLHMRNIWQITMATSTSQQVPTTFGYFKPQWKFQLPVIKVDEEELDIQQNVLIIKVITGNCWLSLCCASPLQLNYQKIEPLKFQWYTCLNWHW